MKEVIVRIEGVEAKSRGKNNHRIFMVTPDDISPITEQYSPFQFSSPKSLIMNKLMAFVENDAAKTWQFTSSLGNDYIITKIEIKHESYMFVTKESDDPHSFHMDFRLSTHESIAQDVKDDLRTMYGDVFTTEQIEALRDEAKDDPSSKAVATGRYKAMDIDLMIKYLGMVVTYRGE